jgi:hypothetical protein|tara:strand:- start:203 stop:550 length:348 start_codon:yes stop_codon:yes gene_type:complete
MEIERREMMKLTPKAREAYKAGVADGAVTCSIEKLIATVLAQEVVSYCSKKGTYTFDHFDVEYMVEGLPLVKRLKKELEQLEEENEELQSLLMDARAHTRRQSDIIDSLIHNPER